MTKTLSGRFDALDKARNAVDDLINAGFEREKVYLDQTNALVKVMAPDSAEREVREILGRHDPTEIVARPVKP